MGAARGDSATDLTEAMAALAERRMRRADRHREESTDRFGQLLQTSSAVDRRDEESGQDRSEL